ncbi:zinc finger protein 91-like [Sceloporus undulatus]|uniref:zinc finger protein 91-like n=1 Tax=Sceloporus undulatus TaxID=8520 RepID=UPI001C4AFED9|nr:zinc finger protein 91-like [Sceloporus undulatus]XP_042332090.1 zinc finger protein 91-like [Sceloporus undulatus]
MASCDPDLGEKIPAVLRPLATEETEAAKDWPELHLGAASWMEGGQVWVLELEPCGAETSLGGENVEEISQSSSSMETTDSESLAKKVAVSESQHQSDERKTIPSACQHSKETSGSDGETFSQISKLATNQINQAKNRYACDQCDAAFKWASHLDRHKNVHSGKKASRQSQRWNQKQSAVPMSQKSWVMTKHAKNLHTCDQCGRGFCWPSQLVQHHKNVHHENKATRQGQNKLGEFRPSFLHQKSIAKTDQSCRAKQPLTCNQCGKDFWFPSDLGRHQRVHSRRNAARQNLCRLEGCCPNPIVPDFLKANNAFADSYKTLSNDSDSTTSTKNLHICGQCGKAFLWPSLLDQHHKNVHHENKATRQNNNKVGVSRPSLLHQKSTLNTDKSCCAKRPLICNQCGKVFRYPSDLTRHQLVHSRRNAGRQNLCQLEGCCTNPMVPDFLKANNADSYKTFSNHSDSTTYTKNLHICDQCGRGFQWPSDLTHHQNIHSKRNAVRQNQNLCQLEACSPSPMVPGSHYSKNAFVNSYKTLSEDSDSTTCTKNLHICDLCGKTFQLLSNLARHKLTHIRRKRRNGKCTQFKNSNVCDQCGQKFKWFCDLARHECTKRKQEKSHLCEQCGQSFKCASDFIQHMSNHSSERPYSCTICELQFKRHAQLKGHLKWHAASHEMEGEGEDQKHQGVHGQDLPGVSILKDQLQCLNLPHSEEDNQSFASLKSCEFEECHISSPKQLPPNTILEIGVNGVPHILPLIQTCECGYCETDDGNFDMKSPELPHLKTDITANSELPSALSTNSSVLITSSEDHMERKKTSTASTAAHAQWSVAVAGQSHNDPVCLPKQASHLTGKEKLFSCPKCQKQFSFLSYLTRHLQVHQPGKPYQCTTCKKCFARRSYLHKHRRLHTVNLAHECPECGSYFTQITYLRRHMHKHTKQKQEILSALEAGPPSLG